MLTADSGREDNLERCSIFKMHQLFILQPQVMFVLILYSKDSSDSSVRGREIQHIFDVEKGA